MKSVYNIIFYLTVLFSINSLISCKAKPCDGIVCGNGGICNSGVCSCPQGYEGVRCEVISRTKFLGSYVVSEDGTASLPSQYTVNIHEAGSSESINKVKFKGFYNFFEDEVYGYCSGDSVKIPLQNLTGGYKTQGYGIFSPSTYYGTHGTMDLYYKVIDPSGLVNDFGFQEGYSSEWSK